MTCSHVTEVDGQVDVSLWHTWVRSLLSPARLQYVPVQTAAEPGPRTGRVKDSTNPLGKEGKRGWEDSGGRWQDQRGRHRAPVSQAQRVIWICSETRRSIIPCTTKAAALCFPTDRYTTCSLRQQQHHQLCLRNICIKENSTCSTHTLCVDPQRKVLATQRDKALQRKWRLIVLQQLEGRLRASERDGDLRSG